MDQEPVEHPRSSHPAEPGPELHAPIESKESLSLNQLAETLGFTESDELRAIRANWVEAIKSGSDNAREFAIAYQEQAEAADAEYLANFKRGREQVYDWMMHGPVAARPAEPDTPAESEATVLATAAALGFTETTDMRLLRARIALAVAHERTRQVTAAVADQVVAYNKLANRHESRHGAKFQIGLLLTKATVWRDAGKSDFYREDLADAQDYAQGMGFDEVVDIIQSELDS